MQIKNRFTGEVLFEGEAEDIRQLIRMAIDSGANLRGANIRNANSTNSRFPDGTNRPQVG